VRLAPLVIVTLAACGGPSRSVTPVSTAPPSLDDVAWIAGDWLVDDEGAAEHWRRAPTAIWGVSLDEHGFEVMVIDTGGAGGALRLTPSPDGERSVHFTRSDDRRDRATFSNPAHDDPTSITYTHESGAGAAPERLIAQLHGPEGERRWPMTAISDSPPAAPEVIAAATERHAAKQAPAHSWRSLPKGRVAATLTIDGDASEIVIWRQTGADGRWAPVYEDRRP
jgi:hypothetical protein